MTDSIWMRNRIREEKSAGMNPYRGAQYFADDFEVLPTLVRRTREEVAALAEEEFGPPENPRKTRSPA